MSPRAAWRLESLGFPRVYDYLPGKADWFAAGLPREGTRASIPRAGDVARRDEVTCRLGDRLGDVAERVRAAGQLWCLVLNDEDIVLGRLRSAALDADPDALVEDVMESGPTTTRPDVEVDTLTERLRSRDASSNVIASSDGRLIGTFTVGEAEPKLEGGPESCLCE